MVTMIVRLAIFISLALIFLLDLCIGTPQIHFLGMTSSLNIRFIMCKVEIHHHIYTMDKKLDHKKNEEKYDENKEEAQKMRASQAKKK